MKSFRRASCSVVFAALFAMLLPSRASATGEAGDWYTGSFYLLHEDHHTGPTAAVGADADPAETERLVNLSRPDVIQIHAKGNPGWTTYPSKIGHVPPKLARDVLGLWHDIARKNGYHWSIYYNIGRDGEIMKRRPEWNRSRRDGSEWERALCYHSGVAEGYLWPMIEEIMAGYEPDGFWFDGSVFTIHPCFCPACRRRLKTGAGFDLPEGRGGAAWSALHEVQREVYREFVGRTCKRIHAIDPDCLVTFNWAYSLRMPEKPNPGIAYLTGDIANRVEGLSPEAHWYDGVGLPFDLMTTGYTYVDDDGRTRRRPKPAPQIQQEMAVIIANGGRFNLWDNPSPTSAVDPNLHQFYGRVVAPFLRSRRQWCLGSRRVPDVSLLHSSAAHYALADRTANSFNRADPAIDGATDLLARLHLDYEIVGDWRLREQDIGSGLLIVEHPAALDREDVTAMTRYVESGGHVLLTGQGIHHDERLKRLFGLATIREAVRPETLTCTIQDRRYSFTQTLFRVQPGKAEMRCCAADIDGARWPFLTVNEFGRGLAYYAAVPIFSSSDKEAVPFDLVRDIMNTVWPAERRHVTTEAPAHVEIALRRNGSDRILHLINMAPGERTYAPKRGWYRPVTIHSLPRTGPHKTTVRLPGRPETVILQPEAVPLEDWTYKDGRIELRVPPFDVHRMIVIELDE
jgi:hypothetical protein